MTPTKIVSFDFFDTLCGRRCPTPENVFDIIGEYLCIPSFRERRIRAQQAAFDCMHLEGKKTITIHDIYAKLNIDGYTAEELVEIEVQHELEVSRPITKVTELYKQCVLDSDILVYITSDMYLGSSFYLSCLALHSLPPPDLFLISCERDEKKRDDGGLFNLLLQRAADLGIIDLFHIGDNPISDIANALNKNIRAILWSNSCDLSQAIENILWPKPKQVYTVSEGIGNRSIAPSSIIESLAIVARYCLDYSVELSIGNGSAPILFAARDGFVLHKLWNRLGYGDHYGLIGLYLPCSRAVAIKCGTSDSNYPEFALQFSSGIDGLQTSDLFQRLGLDCVPMAQLEKLGLQRRLAQHDSIFALNIAYLFKDSILGSIARQKSLLVQYLAGNNVIGAETRTVLLFDIGWTGTSHFFLHRLFSLFSLSLNGIYFSLNEASASVVSRRKIMPMHSVVKRTGHCDTICSAIYSSRLLFEYFFSAPHPTVLGYKQYDKNSRQLSLFYDERSGTESIPVALLPGNRQYERKRVFDDIVDFAARIDSEHAAEGFSHAILSLISVAQSGFLSELPYAENFDGWSFTPGSTKSLLESA